MHNDLKHVIVTNFQKRKKSLRGQILFHSTVVEQTTNMPKAMLLSAVPCVWVYFRVFPASHSHSLSSFYGLPYTVCNKDLSSLSMPCFTVGDVKMIVYSHSSIPLSCFLSQHSNDFHTYLNIRIDCEQNNIICMFALQIIIHLVCSFFYLINTFVFQTEMKGVS